jgi:hypothetical protein
MSGDHEHGHNRDSKDTSDNGSSKMNQSVFDLREGNPELFL